MGFDLEDFGRKDKKSGGVHQSMLAERMSRFGAFAALLMFFFASVSTSQLMFLELESNSEFSALYSSSRSIDSDSDGILDPDDECENGNTGWLSNYSLYTNDDADDLS